MGLSIAFAILAALGLIAAIRLAPSDPGVWHINPATLVPEAAGWNDLVQNPPAATDGPQPMPGGAYAQTILRATSAPDALRRLAAIAATTPRTHLLAGSAEQGRMTWVTRSRVWGFPDYTTAQAVQSGPDTHLSLAARLRFGGSDFGVNAARLTDWLAKL